LLGAIIQDQGVVVASWSGTLWQGRAERVVLRAPEGDWHLGTVTWKLQATSLLRLRPRVAVDAQWQAQRMSGWLIWQGPNALLCESIAMQLPAAVLSTWLPIDVQGTLTADIERVLWREMQLESAQGRVVWDNASWRGSAGAYQLGRYVLELSDASAGNVDGRVLTLSGPVQVAGGVQLEAGRRYAVGLGIGPRGRLPEELEQALGLIATPRDEIWDLQFKGAW
jgi:general secretion pathway protein N